MTMENLSLKQLSQKLRELTNINTPLSSVKTDLFTITNMPREGSLKKFLQAINSIIKFAPEVRLHRDEPNSPSSVPWYLNRVRMRRHRKWWPDAHFFDRGEVTVSRLVSQSNGGEYSGRGLRGTEFFLEIWGMNDGDNDYIEVYLSPEVDENGDPIYSYNQPQGKNWPKVRIPSDKMDVKKGNLSSAECYVYFRHSPNNSQRYDIQYWFFYPYNDFGPGHEGDWEHVTVRLNDDFTVEKIFYASHAKESSWRLPGDFAFTQSGHPIVYSAKGSHACYWNAGRQHRPLFLPDDHTGEGGAKWKTSENLKLIGEHHDPFPGQEWINYTGHWGEIGTAVFSGLLVTSGPRGPAFQAWWDDDDKGNEGA